MPLQLGNESTSRDQLIVYDINCAKQKQEAECRAISLLKAGFTLGEKSAGSILLLHPPMDENCGLFRILSDNGDDRVVWDRTNPSQVKEAFKKFKELIGKGYTAFTTLSTGKKGHKIEDFDPGLQEILMIPSSVPG